MASTTTPAGGDLTAARSPTSHPSLAAARATQRLRQRQRQELRADWRWVVDDLVRHIASQPRELVLIFAIQNNN